MASPPDLVYFPPLGQCLNGNQLILSWKLVASALQDDRILSDAVSQFLQDTHVCGLIMDPIKAFEKPSPQTKNDFETQTAAVNLTPTQNNRYDIKSIKQDALWLSQNVDINEVAALRIVAIEFQDRPQSHLCGALSTQDVINLQQAVGADGSQANSLLASVIAADTIDGEKIWSQFNSETSRRQRLLETYMSERRYFALFLDRILHLIIESTFVEPRTPNAALSDQLLRSTFGDSAGLTRLRHRRREELLARYMARLPECVASAENVPTRVSTSIELELDWLRTALTEATHLMSTVFQLVDLVENGFLPAETVSAWFAFVDAYSFLDALQGADERTTELLLPIKSLVCVISMKLLNIPRAIPFLDGQLELHADEDSYITSEEVMRQIDETLINAANAGLVTAGPVVFTWTLITQQMLRLYYDRQERRDLLQNRQAQEGFEREVQHLEARPGVGRRNSAGSIVSMETQPYDKFLTSVFGTSQQHQDLQRLEQLAIAVTAGGQMHNFMIQMAGCLGESHNAPFCAYLGARMRIVMLEFLNFSFPVVGYITESLSTFLSILSDGCGYWDISGKKPLPARQDVLANALDDPLTRQFYVQQVWLRWPYEFAPFTRLCKIISMSLAKHASSSLKNALAATPTLTFHLPNPYWEFAGDENDLGRLELVRDVHLFSVLPSRKRLLAREDSFCIPAGATGQLVSDSNRIIQVHYSHSTFALLGKRLETNLAGDSYDLALGELDADDLAETISFLATAIRCETAKAAAENNTFFADHAASEEILQAAGRELALAKDIVTVITDTFDSFVDSDLVNLEISGVRVMSACLQFLDSVLPIYPTRVWSYLTRCNLLKSPSKPGLLSQVTGALDLVDEQFELLVTIANLFSSLVESAMAGAVQRKTGSKTNGRSTDQEYSWQAISDNALAQVALSIAHTAVYILGNSVTWHFASEVHRSILLGDLIPTLNRLLTYSLGITNDSNQNTVTTFLQTAARHVIDAFVSPPPSSLIFQPLLASMMVALGLPDSTLYQRRAELISKQQIAVLEFATTLIRVANTQDQPATAVEGQLLKCSALLARLCATSADYKESALSLLSALAERISQDTSEAPSLLGYLGAQVSRSFLQTVSRLDKPFNRPTESKNIWTFFATIMRNGQHWMANCLLTGKTPREALGVDGKLSKLAPDSILKTALQRLRLIRTLPTSETLAILDLLTSAHNYWQWTVFASQDDYNYLNELRTYVRELKPTAVTAKVDIAGACDQARIAAYIAEAFAMHLYHLRKTGREKEFARELAADLDFYLREGVTVAGYNSSLHGNFSKNFAKQYPPFKLENFQRSLLSPRQLGNQYYYALDMADKMLSFDPGWAGPRERNGFRNEMETANLNLSLVDAQVALFHAWKFLLLELSNCLSKSENLMNTQLTQVAKQCLNCNQTTQGPERIFLRITQSRAILALVILQRLPTSSISPKDTAELISLVWATISNIETPLVPDQVQHWRTMLRMLYVALRLYQFSAMNVHGRQRTGDRAVEVTQCVLNILQRVVAQGFRLLVGLAHDSDTVVLPEDFALITAILQACLCLPAMNEFSGEILSIVISEDVGQVALSLFSWADKLAIKGDPLCGELSILFLLQLSNVPAIAEHLASEGLLAQLTSASLTSHIQGANVSPFSDNIGAQRCYDIWAKGILPLLLNILSTPGLGPNIATEVAYVLNQFPNLLASSVERIDAPGLSRTAFRGANYITLLGVSEINSLALLTRILTGYRTNFNHEIPEVPWDSATVLESVEYWLATRKMLREKLLPLGQREADWRAMKTDVEEVSVLEQKAVSLLEAVKEVLSDDLE